MKNKIKKAGSNWVDGDRFYDREFEIDELTERVHGGIHTLLTAQRRMGKTSLARELLRRLREKGQFATVFVDLEATESPQDAVAEIALQSQSVRGAGVQIKRWFADTLGFTGEVEISVSDVKLKLRAAINAGNWQSRGDEVFAALAKNDLRVVLVIDELPLLVNRLLKGQDYLITPERKQAVDGLMSWLRKNGQDHQGRICMILSGSVSLEPILQQAGLSAHVNIFSPFDLKPWSEETAAQCLAELAKTYSLQLSLEARQDMCRRLRCNIPHHVQQFFDCLHLFLSRAGRSEASLEDVERVYDDDMLAKRGQMHYETRLKTALGTDLYQLALDLLTEAAVQDGQLRADAIERYRERHPATAGTDPVPVVLDVLEQDGYLEQRGDGYRFVSGLLQDWWHARHGRFFVPIGGRRA